MAANGLSGVQREQEAQIRQIRFEKREAPQVVGGVSRHDAQPRIEEVITLVEHAPVMSREHLHRLCRRGLERSRLRAVQDQRERTDSEEVAVHLEFGERVAQLPHGGPCGVVDQHLLRPGVRGDVVDERDPLIEEMAPARLDVAPHAVNRAALPLQAPDELSW